MTVRNLSAKGLQMYWMENADFVSSGQFLIGEDADGELCAPTWERFADGSRVWRRINRRNPVWWLRYLSSRFQRKVMFIDVPDDITIA